MEKIVAKSDIVDYLIDKDLIFKNSNNLYQDILYYLQHREYDNFNNIVNKEYENVSDAIKTTIKTFQKFSKYIKNTLEYSYSNGVMERNNNTCKLTLFISIFSLLSIISPNYIIIIIHNN